MAANNIINFVFFNNVILILYKYSQKHTALKKLSLPLAFVIGGVLMYYLQATIGGDNYYRFLNIPRTYNQEEVTVGAKSALKKYHPDKRTGDADLFLMAQELSEILQSSQGQNLMSIYNDFAEDPRVIFYDKFANKNYKTYQVEAINDLEMNFYIFLIMEMILLEEVHTSSTINYTIIGCIVLGYAFEATLYGYKFLSAYKPALELWISQMPILRDLPNFLLIDFVKKSLTVIGTIIMLVWLNIKRSKKTLKFEQLWGKISDRLLSKYEPGSLSADLSEQYFKKLNRRIENKQKEMRYLTYLVIFLCLYFAAGYFNLLPKVVLFFLQIIRQKPE